MLQADFDNSLKVDYNDLSRFADYWLFDYDDAYMVWWWDYAEDGRIDFADLDYLLDYWPDYFNFVDFADFARYWQEQVDVRYFDTRPDLFADGRVDLRDFAVFAKDWLKSQSYPMVSVVVYGDVNNISGSFEVGVNSSNFAAAYDFLYMDGRLLAKVPEIGGLITVDSPEFRNGIHGLKIVQMGLDGQIIVSTEQPVIFNNPIYCSDINDHFYAGLDYRISGLHDGNSTIDMQITNLYGQVIWADTYSGSDVNIVIPQNIFNNQMLCNFSATETGETKTMSVDVAKGFDPSDYNDAPKMIIVLPDKDVFKDRKPAIYECTRACNRRNVSWVSLYHYDVTEENLRFLYNKSSVKYVYWCGHANSHVGRNEREGIPGIQRTNTGCWVKGIMLPKNWAHNEA